MTLKDLYYITHIDNIPSILKSGILSHEEVEKRHIQYTPIYDKKIVKNRRNITAPNGKNLWSFANLYFQPRNPMLYRLICEKLVDEIVILALQKSEILNRDDIFISNGNAASSNSDILPATEGKETIYKMRKVLAKEWWTEESGGKRKIMAECLVQESISSDYIQTIYVANHAIVKKVKKILLTSNIPVIPEPKMFFQPSRKIKITPLLSVVDGDMFFSRMQTHTISVNCVGIMGKGLASRAKWQFPDVYVYYQYACRKKILQMGRPYLYKRESSLDYRLADEPSSLKNGNAETWFLLFPTKNHWREDADIQGIEKGLQWLKDNFKKENLKSLAIPALGCGLGRLNWRDVGPLLCKYLYDFDIPAMIYLPAEKKITDETLSKEFLLSRRD